jgi:hypothetical protein
MTEFKDLVVKVLQEANGQPMSATQIAEKLNAPVQAVNVAMRWLYEDKKVTPDFKTRKVRTKYGSYSKPVFGSYTYKLKGDGT